MAEKETYFYKADVLRRQAEEKAAEMTENQETMSPEETRLMLYELRVHQIELEMQNAEIVDACARYHTIYDLAPVGYFTLSEHGTFLEANITASTMLGVDRGMLINQQITRFILKEDQDIYYFHHKQLSETRSAPCQDLVQANLEQTGEPHVCELRMVKNDGTSFWAHIAATTGQDTGAASASFVIMSDITKRKLAEAKIQDALEYAENIVETVREPLPGPPLNCALCWSD